MDEDGMSCNRPPKMAIKSQRLRNPFLIKIDSQSLKVDNYKHGVFINIVCECSFWLFSFWGVKIKEFHEKFSYDWITIKNKLIDNELISDSAYYSNDPELYRDEYNKIVHKINVPEQFDSNEFFNTTPRDRYPLAIILLLNDREIEDELQSNDIVMLASIVHLKDTLVPLDTSIIAQYIKRKSGLVLNLQDLYISGGQEEERMPYCIICLDNHITRALLPCRHACVCSYCLERINCCPLCRSPIQNFIMINQPISIKNSQEQYEETKNNHNSQSFLERIQKFFGF